MVALQCSIYFFKSGREVFDLGIFNLDELKSSNRDRNEVTQWCIEATKEFFDAAKELKTAPFTRNSKYSFSPLTNKQNITKTVHDLSISILPMKVVEFYVIMFSSKFDSDTLNEDYSAAATLKDGTLYFDGHKSNASEIGAAIADICGYEKDIVEELFKSALHGEPWDVAYAIKQREKNKNPRVSIDGDNNIVSGRDVTKL